MRLEKHLEIIREVEAEIQAALDDPAGILSHQRRLAFMVSLGVTELLEIYFHKKNILKEGSRLKHEWFKKKNIREILEKQIIVSLDMIPHIDDILSRIRHIEETRNILAYSSPRTEDPIQEYIHQYFSVKRRIEKEVSL